MRASSGRQCRGAQSKTKNGEPEGKTPSEKTTSFDIAYHAGVSQPTVSRALRGDPTVSEETRKRIEAIARRLNYKVDKNASNLRFQQSKTLALLLFEDPAPGGSLINPFFVSVLGSITRACGERGYDLLVSFQHMSGDWHTDYEDRSKADGIILLGYGDYLAYRARLEQLVKQGTHFVRWGAVEEGQPGLSIGSDNFQGGYDMTRHLIAHSRRKIAFLGNASSHYPEFFARYRGYEAALKTIEAAPSPALQCDAVSSEEAGYAAAHALIERAEPFDAVLCASDLIAIGALRALHERGLDVPGAVSVAGFDDIPAASHVTPPLTTVMQDTRLAGEVLVETLLKRIRGEEVEGQVLPTRLAVRGSCGANGGANGG